MDSSAELLLALIVWIGAITLVLFFGIFLFGGSSTTPLVNLQAIVYPP